MQEFIKASLRLGNIAVWKGNPSGFLNKAVTANQSAIPPTKLASLQNNNNSKIIYCGYKVLKAKTTKKQTNKFKVYFTLKKFN